MAENTNASRMYVVEESVSGTLKAPSGGSEALALQPGFDFVPNADVITNETLNASIGPSKPITGTERPNSSFSHYLRHSGTEGVVPDYHLLLKSLFASTTTNGTERATTTGSTTTVIKLAAGGTDFSRGFALLIKDGTNGYNIRPVDSVATNDLTIGFSVPTAPGNAINVGKCINYTPADTGHPTLSLWLYRANGAAIEAISGALVTGVEISVETGQLVNMSFTAEGTKFFFDPIVITSANKYIDATDDGGTIFASITEKTYRTPLELAQALEDALNTASVDVWTVTYNSTGANKGKFTIASDGTTTSLLWKTGTHGSDNADDHIGTTLGFSDAADDTGANSYNSDNVQVWSDALTPALDDTDPLVAKYHEALVGDQTNYVSMCVQSMTANINLETEDVLCLSAESGIDSKVVRRRTSSIEITAVLEKHDADKFDRFINNTTTKFLYNFGVRSGGNWVAGKCGCLYSPQATISGFRVGDNNGVVTMVFTISPYVASDATPEIYLNLL